MKSILPTIILLFFLTACESESKFNKKDWLDGDCQHYPMREKMLNDVMKNHLANKSYQEIIQLLGDPEYTLDSKMHFAYAIVTDYRGDIDPVYVKVLQIQLNKDSIVTGFQIREWDDDL